MDTLIHADIFFFVTTVAVVVVAVLAVVVLVYLIKILGRIHDVAKEIKEEAVLVRGDLREARAKIKSGLQAKHIVDSIGRVIGWTGWKPPWKEPGKAKTKKNGKE